MVTDRFATSCGVGALLHTNPTVEGSELRLLRRRGRGGWWFAQRSRKSFDALEVRSAGVPSDQKVLRAIGAGRPRASLERVSAERRVGRSHRGVWKFFWKQERERCELMRSFPSFFLQFFSTNVFLGGGNKILTLFTLSLEKS